MKGQLMTPASSITMIDDYGTSETLSWFDGPFLACGMLAVSYAPSALSMYGPNWYSVYSGGDVINDVMPTSSWLPGFEVATQGANVLMLKPIKVEVTATPKSVPSSAIASSTGTSSAGAFPAPSTELSSQSKIGIGVGVGLGVTLLLAIFGTLLLTRRAGKKNKLRVEAYSDKPELDGQTIKKEPYAVEIDDGHVHEIDGTDIPVETEASNHIQEIEDTGISVECDVPSNDPEMEANHGTTELGETSIR
ncbi:hypothetical protein SLS60_010895 [Paraconiothyrium brasiliense]|uniref:Transmembrane protein n=1 Tax=Paraconiothyrium brasiliense TaxID=300254 RepID=A0ABR3QMB1_9PLEO